MHKIIVLNELVLQFKRQRQGILAARGAEERTVICLLYRHRLSSKLVHDYECYYLTGHLVRLSLWCFVLTLIRLDKDEMRNANQ